MDLETKYISLREKCVESLEKWNRFINKLELNSSTDVDKLKEITKEYCLIDNNHQRKLAALSQVKDVVSSNPDENIDELFKQTLLEQDMIEPNENEIWQNLFTNNQSIREVLKDQPNSAKSFERVDDSLMCSNDFSIPIDPISKTPIQNVLRNKNCNHLYNQDSILGYISQAAERARCPYIGCQNRKLRRRDLVNDDALQRKIDEYLSRQQSNNSSDED
ncbi:hypothetical protein ABEB36_009737 [Hypothenemus hampei]|uniref:E3 SUMO-protein ligase NSE2 n=1 Tax=Hypothenemus hampei TaxID=57062 RepID=A0ABD1EHA9_HYPHA